MDQKIKQLLKETNNTLKIHNIDDNSSIHSKILALFMYLKKYHGENRTELVKEYNKIVESALEKGVEKIKKIEVKEDIEEKNELKERKEENTKEDETRITSSILEHSKTLKQRTESFGSMLEMSKGFLEKVTGSVQKNVSEIEKNVSVLDSKPWWSFDTTGMLSIIVFVIVAFILIYALIRSSNK
ncbi:hypothetical protein NEOKW01_1973 [Nematocida sp. AWRm80]|nr:hypothetical protein NEOKW01_1973 [Nematocida sp. AWRm80]